MTPLALLPAWFPTEPLVVALGVILLGERYLNKGDRRFLVIPGQDEIVLLGIGAGMTWAAVSGYFTETLNVAVVPMAGWLLIGLALTAVAVVARFTDYIDIEGLV